MKSYYLSDIIRPLLEHCALQACPQEKGIQAAFDNGKGLFVPYRSTDSDRFTPWVVCIED